MLRPKRLVIATTHAAPTISPASNEGNMGSYLVLAENVTSRWQISSSSSSA
jgi:hypothetical protein